MPFIPHTDQDIKEMLDTIGIRNIDALLTRFLLHCVMRH